MHRGVIGLLVLIGVFAGCSDDEVPSTGGGSTEIALAGVTAGVLFDDLHFAPASRSVVAAAGGSRRVFRLSVESQEIVSVDDFGVGAASVDEANGRLFVLDRAAKLLHVVEIADRRVVVDAPLEFTPDYVRFCPFTNEVWVTEPSGQQIEIFGFPHAGSAVVARIGSVFIGDGPEGITFDMRRRRAYVHHYSPRIGVIDVDERSLVASWATGCSSSHGIPTHDEERGFVFAGCRERPRVAVLAADEDGKILGEHVVDGTGATALAYSPSLRHFYLRGDPGAKIVVLGIPSTGKPVELGTFAPPELGHVMAADDRGQLWVADPAAGRLLRFTDPHPATP